MTDTKLFPDNWPSGCPPEASEPADGTVYRLVSSNPPAEVDFRTNFEEGTFPHRPPCLRCALSVFRDINDAYHNRKLYPKALSDKLIASGGLDPAHGKTFATPGKLPSHTSWWPYQGIARHTLFRVCSPSSDRVES
jgi:hypothetical protein